jgi:hypothetical protein
MFMMARPLDMQGGNGNTVRPELVEGPSFFSSIDEKGRASTSSARPGKESILS